MPEINKILIIRFSSLGDLILSFPLLKKLQEIFPQSEIHFLTKMIYQDILSINPNVDKIILEDTSLKKLRKKIQQDYDLIIDIHKNFKSIFVSLFNKTKTVRIRKENFKKILLVKFKINLFKNILPVYKKYLFTIKNFLSEYDYEFVTTELKFDKERIIKDDYIVISPSSRHFTKTFPKEKFVEYINNLKNKTFVLVGDNSVKDRLICDYIESQCKNVLKFCENLDINSLANVLYNSEYVISNDSAILHFSEALGKKVVAIFGSTVKEFGFFPQLKDSIVLENKNLKCRPCTHVGRSKCPEGHFKCMKEVDIIVNYENKYFTAVK